MQFHIMLASIIINHVKHCTMWPGQCREMHSRKSHAKKNQCQSNFPSLPSFNGQNYSWCQELTSLHLFSQNLLLYNHRTFLPFLLPKQPHAIFHCGVPFASVLTMSLLSPCFAHSAAQSVQMQLTNMEFQLHFRRVQADLSHERAQTLCCNLILWCW